MAEEVRRAEDLSVGPDGDCHDAEGRRVVPGALHGHTDATTDWGELPDTDALNLPARPTAAEWAAAHETYVADLAAQVETDQLKEGLDEVLQGALTDVSTRRELEGADQELLDRLEGQIVAFETRLRAIYSQYTAEELHTILGHEMPEEIYDAIGDTLNLLIAQEYAKAYEAEDKTPAPTVEEVIGESRELLLKSLELLALARGNDVAASAIAVLEENADEMFVNLANVSMYAWQYTPEQLTQLEAGVDALYEEIQKHFSNE